MAEAENKEIKLKLNWGSKKFDVEFDVTQGIDAFRGVIFSLTLVPPEKQKILRRKTNIDSDEALLGLKDKAQLKLIGSAESAPVKGDETVVFAEDLSATEQAKLGDAMPQAWRILETLVISMQPSNACKAYRSSRKP